MTAFPALVLVAIPSVASLAVPGHFDITAASGGDSGADGSDFNMANNSDLGMKFDGTGETRYTTVGATPSGGNLYIGDGNLIVASKSGLGGYPTGTYFAQGYGYGVGVTGCGLSWTLLPTLDKKSFFFQGSVSNGGKWQVTATPSDGRSPVSILLNEVSDAAYQPASGGFRLDYTGAPGSTLSLTVLKTDAAVDASLAFKCAYIPTPIPWRRPKSFFLGLV